MQEDKLVEFTKEFFKTLECSIKEEGDVLVVEKAPEKFEKYYGKAAPYKIIFSREREGTEGFDVVTKGSYLLKAMISYLGKSGETTLLKIKFDVHPEEEIKKRIFLSNCEIARLTQKKKHDYFSRFTFLTTFEYLNGKEQLTNDVYVYSGNVIQGDLSRYNVVDGDKRDIVIENIDREYSVSREELKERLKEKIQEISFELKIKLDKELERIESHFNQIILERGENLKKLENRKLLLDSQKDFGEDIEEVDKKISRLETEINNLKENTNLEELEKEKEREKKLELTKHSLNVSNKLINTTIIYYPLLYFDVFLKNKNSKRMVEVTYNPLSEELSESFCEKCGKKAEKFLLDGSGHLICEKCVNYCGECKEIYCEKCLIKKCSFCNKKLCLNCSVRCNSCGKDFCKSHTEKDVFDGKAYCFNCMSVCTKCGGRFKPSSKGQKNICEKCNMEAIKKETLGRIFKND